jgi:von Willebrand factor type A domain
MHNVRMWALWRRFQYGVGYTVCLMLVATGVYYRYFYQAPTCFDNKQNGIEMGLDCGGACTRICAFTVKPPVVQWAKSFPAQPGQYNALAYVENSNHDAGTPNLRYTFTLKDRNGVIASKSGTTILPPYSTYPIFEGRIDTAGRIPTDTSITLEPVDVWVPDIYGDGQFRSGDLSLIGADTQPRLTASIQNTFLTDAKNIEVVATIFDSAGTPLTSSQTFIDSIPGQQSMPVTFTWAQPIAKTLRSCLVPTDVIMAIDLSGSMNNDGGNPPQPVSAVLTAAKAFVSQLRPSDRVSVITFASQALLRLPLSTSTKAGADIIAGLTIDPKEEKGTTNTGDALKAAAAEW